MRSAQPATTTGSTTSTLPVSWTGDVSGGLTGAVVSLAFALSFGLLAFAPLGADYAVSSPPVCSSGKATRAIRSTF
jgi:hypothetical protein